MLQLRLVFRFLRSNHLCSCLDTLAYFHSSNTRMREHERLYLPQPPSTSSIPSELPQPELQLCVVKARPASRRRAPSGQVKTACLDGDVKAKRQRGQRGGKTTHEMRARADAKASAKILLREDALTSFIARSNNLPNARAKDAEEQRLGKAVSCVMRLFTHLPTDFQLSLMEIPHLRQFLDSSCPSFLKKKLAQTSDPLERRKMLRSWQLSECGFHGGTLSQR